MTPHTRSEFAASVESPKPGMHANLRPTSPQVSESVFGIGACLDFGCNSPPVIQDIRKAAAQSAGSKELALVVDAARAGLGRLGRSGEDKSIRTTVRAIWPGAVSLVVHRWGKSSRASVLPVDHEPAWTHCTWVRPSGDGLFIGCTHSQSRSKSTRTDLWPTTGGPGSQDCVTGLSRGRKGC